MLNKHQPKSPTILERKPNLKICSNHLKDGNTVGYRAKRRVFVHGQAFKDGRGWYK